MGYQSGLGGSLKYNDAVIAKVANWSLSSAQAALEVSELGKNARLFSSGLKSATGTASIWLYNQNHQTLTSKIIRTDKPLDSTDHLSMELIWEDRSILFKSMLGSCNVTSNTGDAMAANITFFVVGNMTTVDLVGA